MACDQMLFKKTYLFKLHFKKICYYIIQTIITTQKTDAEHVLVSLQIGVINLYYYCITRPTQSNI